MDAWRVRWWLSITLISAAMLFTFAVHAGAVSSGCRHVGGRAGLATFTVDGTGCSRATLWRWSSTSSVHTSQNPRPSTGHVAIWWSRCSAKPWSAIPSLVAVSLNGGRLTGAACNPAIVIPRAVTSIDVLMAIKRIGLPVSNVGVPRYTLVNLKTTFYTHAAPFTRRFRLLGRPIVARVTPDRYIWSWGDGQRTTTDRPGKPYPSTEVTHTYVHRTHGDRWMRVYVSVRYRCEFRVSGGSWQGISQTITIDGPASTFPVKEATAVLVPH